MRAGVTVPRPTAGGAEEAVVEVAGGAAAVGGAAAGDAADRLWLLGVRHHGPGSARAVRAALDQYQPRAVLIEGPPEADGIVGMAADEDLRPPVALLAHVADDPARAAFWPFAEFSPEWVAIRWAVRRGVPVHFIDLPAANSLAVRADREASSGRTAGPEGGGRKPPEPPDPSAPGGPPPDSPVPDGPTPDAPPPGPPVPDGPVPDGPAPGAPAPGAPAPGAPPLGGPAPAPHPVRVDPLAVLAEAAGYDDPERWWEDAVEHRTDEGDDALAPFAAVAEAMRALRETYDDGGHPDDPIREAHMRLRIRESVRTHDRTAVVCGAWHVPALTRPVTVTADRRTLKGLPKVKAEITWVPWTHRRLGRSSGYGAGIDSPGWYRHLFTAPDRPVTRWMTGVAGLLRQEDHPVSSAHVIEAVRLAETLAAMRGRPLAGLGEADDAVRAVMCDGSDVPLALVRDRLVVGDDLGRVPDHAPAVPLARDLARRQRTLRLKPEPGERELELDLRGDTDAGRSRLLHRLAVLGVTWGEPVPGRAGTGTFRETWRLRWEPELSVRVAEAGVWGTTVCVAATARAQDAASSAATLADVTAVAERCLLAELPDALPVVMRTLADKAALDADVGHLAGALPALVRSVRYGDVRGTRTETLREVAEGLATRICVGLPPACSGLGDEGAARMRGHLDAVHAAMALLAQETDLLRERWTGTVRALAERDGGVPGLIRGRAARLLLDDGLLDTDEAARLMGRALSSGSTPGQAAAWVDGFLSGGGMLLVHDERLLALVDSWLGGVPAEAFTDVLPLVRRTFAEFEPGVRRAVGELARRGPDSAGAGRSGAVGSGAPGFGAGLDRARADAVLPTLRLLLLGRPFGGGAEVPGDTVVEARTGPRPDVGGG